MVKCKGNITVGVTECVTKEGRSLRTEMTSVRCQAQFSRRLTKVTQKLTFQENHEHCSVCSCTRHWLQDTRLRLEWQAQRPLGTARLSRKANR